MMDVLGRDMRVLIGESVYEDASVTVNDGRMFIEFAADDLEDVMIDLRPLDLCRGAVEITAEMIERGAEGLAAERISNGWHDDAEACLRAALGGQA
jgi:hypothetical protein